MCHSLIIEDEPMIAFESKILLAGEVVTSFDITSTKVEAVAAAKARNPDLITSDVELLEGTGPLTVDQIRNEVGEVPVIFITGTPRCLSAGFGQRVEAISHSARYFASNIYKCSPSDRRPEPFRKRLGRFAATL